ncbi:uncharacterized protein LOC132607296 isoform X2 [Lycium barbarum]|uniref:uncharacterized protein LOC132607296 isoform X2 n=1 Tax=Lycium barbarum TaxID=112863 RepID=UPI00293EA4C1|nr:uncharacterized protein LOC132607296 isoform X2 [Lycium barbarum]
MAIASFSLPLTYYPSQTRWISNKSPSYCCCSGSFEKPIVAPSSSSNCIANKALQEIHNSGVIACLRAQNADLANRAARAALDGGISVGKFPYTYLYWKAAKLENIGGIFQSLNEYLNQSIKRRSDSHYLLKLQLEIVVSTPDAFEVLRNLVHDYPTKTFGVGTVLQAKDAKDSIKFGAKFLMSPATVMVYPVSALGGVGYISALKRPFSHIPMVASQGITIDLIGQYIGHGASAVVLSDAIFDKEAMNQWNFDKIYQLASHAALQGKQAVERPEC